MTEAAVDVSIIIPCLNEERTLRACIHAVRESLQKHGLSGEIVVANNASTDQSRAIAVEEGVRVVDVPEKGYGNALRAGMKEAAGPLLLFLDADLSYDPEDAPTLIAALREGSDLVIGSRFRGTIDPGAMPWLHHRIGTPFLTALANILFRCHITDINCGMRVLTKEAFQRLDLHAEGMEICTEMVVKAVRSKLRIAEAPISLHVDQRGRKPHLRSFRDGWRNLQVMMHYCSIWLFLIPGLLLIASGITLARYALDPHLMLTVFPAGLCFTTFGVEFLLFAFTTQGRFKGSKYAHKKDSFAFWFLTRITRIENGLVLGAMLIVAGIAALVSGATAATSQSVLQTGGVEFVQFPGVAVARSLLGTILFINGMQIFFTSVFIGLFGVRVEDDQPPGDE